MIVGSCCDGEEETSRSRTATIAQHLPPQSNTETATTAAASSHRTVSPVIVTDANPTSRNNRISSYWDTHMNAQITTSCSCPSSGRPSSYPSHFQREESCARIDLDDENRRIQKFQSYW
eukprot:CAMPEP_0203641246 /NCGR_PEP_ID=MMETSP0088-20131115/6565_1 /ASSEMBLY_ACC=CAM_ASM_001087 /TAXON_ID=426623 /ORGANISM="Chaetoceros affinis, Strain CCMP159" /LENGTH=118 /DNA_ID=CAMNT_0050496635 /DNA_START=77 /DNA_END=430 /DNA_ORIENTATION=+